MINAAFFVCGMLLAFSVYWWVRAMNMVHYNDQPNRNAIHGFIGASFFFGCIASFILGLLMTM